MGTPMYDQAQVGVFAGHSFFVSILDHLEEYSLYNSVNFSRNIYTAANTTVQRTILGTFICPSDPTVSRTVTHAVPYHDIPVGQFVTAFTSYAACSGTWYHLDDELALLQRLARQDNGIAFANSAIRPTDIVGGLSQTLLLGERNHAKLSPDVAANWHWWFDGYFGDTLFWTMFPLNNTVAPRQAVMTREGRRE